MLTVNPIRGEKYASHTLRNPLVELLLEEPKLNMRLGKKWRKGAEYLGELESTIVAALVPDTLRKGFGYGVPTAEVAKRCAEILKCEVDEGVMIYDIQAILEPRLAAGSPLKTGKLFSCRPNVVRRMRWNRQAHD